jgi:hypothetical protein
MAKSPVYLRLLQLSCNAQSPAMQKLRPWRKQRKNKGRDFVIEWNDGSLRVVHR